MKLKVLQIKYNKQEYTEYIFCFGPRSIEAIPQLVLWE